MGALEKTIQAMKGKDSEKLLGVLSELAKEAKEAKDSREELILISLIQLAENMKDLPPLIQKLIDKETIEIKQESVQFPQTMEVQVLNQPEVQKWEWPDFGAILRKALPSIFPVKFENSPEKPIYVSLVDEDGHIINLSKLYSAPAPVVVSGSTKLFKHGGQGPAEAHGETPTGTVNSINKDFTLSVAPVTGTLKLYLNGVRQKVTEDYTLSGSTITFVIAPDLRDDGTYPPMLADYRKQ